MTTLESSRLITWGEHLVLPATARPDVENARRGASYGG